MLLQPYSSIWEINFLKIKNILIAAMDKLEVEIEHIGSTVVPGLAAKAIIDLDIVYEKESDFDFIKKQLEKIGYYHAGNQGIIGREVFKKKPKLLPNSVLDTISHHLYVCQRENEEMHKHIAFRNYLLKNEEAIRAYEKLKFEIAIEASQDRKKYAAIKEIKAKGFIEDCIRAYYLSNNFR
jgi:GrpB-like predicted nucleotidyltransferase (UPF0157 family)